MQLAMIKLGLALDRWLDYAYRPDQPRVPAGHPDGGQWTDGNGGGHVINDPPIEEVYPELLILPLLRIPRIKNSECLAAMGAQQKGKQGMEPRQIQIRQTLGQSA